MLFISGLVIADKQIGKITCGNQVKERAGTFNGGQMAANKSKWQKTNLCQQTSTFLIAVHPSSRPVLLLLLRLIKNKICSLVFAMFLPNWASLTHYIIWIFLTLLGFLYFACQNLVAHAYVFIYRWHTVCQAYFVWQARFDGQK